MPRTRLEELQSFDVRWLLERCDLDECKAVFREVLVRLAYSCLKTLLCLRELLALTTHTPSTLIEPQQLVSLGRKRKD